MKHSEVVTIKGREALAGLGLPTPTGSGDLKKARYSTFSTSSADRCCPKPSYPARLPGAREVGGAILDPPPDPRACGRGQR